MSRSRRTTTPVVERMEDRILHSADLLPAAGLDSSGWGAAQQQTLPSQATPGAVQAQRHEIVFVDASLPDAQTLLVGLAANGVQRELVWISADSDGLALISQTLAGRQDIAAIHLITHGSAGQVQLGSSQLDAAALLARADEVAAWADALSADADLLIYGCDVAGDEAGLQLVRDLAALTGADVAASTDLTGAAALGGNWTLETSTGGIETRLAPSLATMSSWQGTLALYVVDKTTDFTGAALLPGTLRWAISQANANAGTDTIVFQGNGTYNMGGLFSGDDNNSGGDFDIIGSLTIIGNGSANTIINGSGVDRVFDVRSGTVSFTGLTIQGGRSNTGAGVRIGNGVTVTMDDVIVQNNVGSGGSKGAGIYSDGNLTMTRSLVRDNGLGGSGEADGAGIYSKSGQLNLSYVEFSGNIARLGKDGGGLYIDGGDATLNNVTFANNQAKRGGGLWNNDSSTQLSNVTFSSNVATQEGGAIYVDKNIALDHVTVVGNSAPSGKGGAIYDTTGQVTMSNTLMAQNAGGNFRGTVVSLGYNLSDSNTAGLSAVGDRRNTAASVLPLANNGGFTRTHALAAGSLAIDAANPITTLLSDQRGMPYYGAAADIGAYEYNPYGLRPTITGVTPQTMDEDTLLPPVGFNIADNETAAGALVVTATSSNTALVPNVNLVLGGSGATRNISLTPAANANSAISGGSTTITLTVSDGGNTSSTSFTVTVNAVNDAPTIALPASQSVDEDTFLTLAGALAPVIGDVDAGSAPVQLTLSANQGLLSLSTAAGLSFVSGSAVNSTSMVFNGTLSAINAALNGLRYAPTPDYNGPAQINFSVNDLGNRGSGGASTASAILALTVLPVNDAPTLDLPGAQSTPQTAPLAFSTGQGNAITLGDVDAASTVMQLSLTTTGGSGNGTLAFGNLNGANVTGGNGSTTIVLQASLAQLNAALDTLVFSATSAAPAQIDLTLDDLGNSGSGGARQVVGSVQITVGANLAPEVTLVQTALTTTEGAAPVPLDANLGVSDPDAAPGTLAGATVRISAGYAGAQDQLFFSPGPTFGDISVTSNTGGVLKLNSAGATATLAQWQAALRTVSYQNTSESPSTATRSVIITVNDGISTSAVQVISLDVSTVNDAPLLSGIDNLEAIDEDDTQSPGTLVSTLLAGHLSDVDNGALTGVAITWVDSSNGSWQYTPDGGTSWGDLAGASESAAMLLKADALTAVRFLPSADWNGTVSNGLRLRAWDRTSGLAGTSADTSVNGGNSPYSTAQAFSGITVRPVNDAPVATGSASLTAVPEDSLNPPGAKVSVLVAGKFSDLRDADQPGQNQLAGVAVVGNASTAVQGQWQFSVDAGSSWQNFAALADATALTLGLNDLLRFLPAVDFNGTPGGLSLRLLDNAQAVASGAVVDVRGVGGSSAVSAGVVEFGTLVTSVNDAPTGADNRVSTDEEVAYAFTAADFGFFDGRDDPSHLLRAVRISSLPLAGVLTLSGHAVTAGDLISEAAINSQLLVFTPAADANGMGYTSFGFQVMDDGSSADGGVDLDPVVRTMSIDVNPVNDAPVVAAAIGPRSATQGSLFSFAVASGAFTDVDIGDALSYSAKLSSGAALPAWLSFNAATRTFSGTPANADVGLISVRVTATDGLLANAYDDFNLTVAIVNDAPTLVMPLADQAATQDQVFAYTVPAGSFADIDVGDVLSYSAKLSSGAALPTWLSFDASTRNFSGAPANADVGLISVRVTATDGSLASVYDDFNLSVANINDAPVLVVPLADQAATQGQAFVYTVPAGSFADIDVGDVLGYSGKLSNGAALPAWLSFNAATHSFSGTPENADVGMISVRITVSDGLLASAYDDFNLTVANINDAPMLVTSLADQAGTQDLAFVYTVPAGSFADIDVGDVLGYSAKLNSGAALPAWLSFNATTRSFIGTPANADAGTLIVRVTATDGSLATVDDDFNLTVANVNDAPMRVTPLADQAATQDQAFAYTVPTGSLADIDVGDVLSYSAKLSSGAALPGWLSFDVTTRSFSGTPANADVGLISVRLTATDGSTASVYDDFNLTVANVNDAPTRVTPLADQAATQDQAFAYTVPTGSFADIDVGDVLSYSAKLRNGASLPAWLIFDASTRSFSGTPTNADVGMISVRVTATDVAGDSVHGDFPLAVRNVNDAPLLMTSLADQVATQGQAFVNPVPANSFADRDVGDVLSYSATLSYGAALPTWLSFDAATRTLGGTPDNADVGVICVRVTATDVAGLSVQDDFQLTVLNVNDAPTLVTPLADQVATHDQGFAYTVPTGSFSDIDVIDVLSYSARLSSGAALPAWLSFDATTRTFNGTPANADVGSLSVRVTATDGSAANVSGNFQLVVANVNDAPRLNGPIAPQSATRLQPFGFSLPAGSFGDIDAGDSLRYSATLADGSALPGWLSFDAANQRFSGIPLRSDLGTLDIRITATDLAGASASAAFPLSVDLGNRAPMVGQSIAERQVVDSQSFSFSLPAGTFADPDGDDQLQLSASLADGSALPNWLRFDADSGRFVGTPSGADMGRLVLRITATDLAGAQAQTAFALLVVPQVPAAQVPQALSTPEASAVAATQAAEPAAKRADAEPAARAAAPLAEAEPAPPFLDALPATPEPVGTPGAGGRNAALAEVSLRSRVSTPVFVVQDVALVAETSEISLAPMLRSFSVDNMMRRFDESALQRRLLDHEDLRGTLMASSTAVASSLSIGYVVWLVRGGVLMSSMLSALPAWQMMDPLPVVTARSAVRIGGEGDAPDDDVERLFDAPGQQPGPPPPSDAVPAQAAAPIGAKEIS